MIVLNLKNYEASYEKINELISAAHSVSEQTDVRIIVCPPNLLLEGSTEYKEIYAQHCDEIGFGACTGSIPADALKLLEVKGSLINHSEKRIPMDKIGKIIQRLNELDLESVCCAENPEEVKEVEKFKPSFIAIEPPELIGSGVSISKAKPELITDSLKVLQELNSESKLLCGAGVCNKEDVKKALDLGSHGVLLASAYVKSKNPKEFLEELISVY